ncbi:MAG TPA: hypothetical protein VK463_01885 [Desulfomonilaceae bacterium]|nr:hypothetical protein [Desulfomonilaceae bacterium]
MATKKHKENPVCLRGSIRESNNLRSEVEACPRSANLVPDGPKPAVSRRAGLGSDEKPRIKSLSVKNRSKLKNLALISRLCLVSFLVVVVMAVVTYLATADRFSVETKLLFVSPEQKYGIPWPLEKELDMLKSPQLAFLLAQDVCTGSDTLPVKRSGWNFEAAAAPAKIGDDPDGKYRSTSDFMKWFSDELVVETSLAPGTAAVKLCLRGDDPEFLKNVLNGYVRLYTDYRRGLAEEAEREFHEMSARTAPVSASSSVDSVKDQLQKLELQSRECELALKLLASGKGPFSGFFPAVKIEGIPTLSHFQQKIVELEISKRSLNVRYTPQSREVRNIDKEMQGIKSAMRECLSEHLHFLQKEKDLISAQKTESGRNRGPTAKRSSSQCSGRLANGDVWFCLTGGLRIIQDKPSISKKPVLVRAGEYTNSLSVYLSAALTPEGGFDIENDYFGSTFRAKDASRAHEDHLSCDAESAKSTCGLRLSDAENRESLHKK